MTRTIDRLAEPRNLRRLLGVFVVFVVIALVLALVALDRELKTAGRVDTVTKRVTRVERPSPAQVRRGVDRAIKGLTVRQRRALLDRLLNSATPAQLRRLRRRAKVVTRRRTRRAAAPRTAPAVVPTPRPRAQGRPRLPRPRPRPAPPAPVGVAPVLPPAAPVLAPPPVVDKPGNGNGKAKGHDKPGKPGKPGKAGKAGKGAQP